MRSAETGRRRVPRERAPADAGGLVTRRADANGTVAERRRASRSLWAACEALLSAPADPRALPRALDELRRAFECDGVALHALSPDGAIAPWCARGLWRTAPGDLRDCMSVPLLRGSERIGTLDLLARPGQRFRAGHLALIRTASGALGAALGARFELERLRHQPGRDAVTGLPDARAFHTRVAEEMSRARRHGVALSVVTLDLDHFGALNAKLGKNVGDEVLAEVALVLKLTLRDTDILARLGGDTFAALLPETDGPAARRAADRLCRQLEEHRFPRAGHLSASAGIASSPRDGVESVELMNAVDLALSVAKKSGRRRVAAPASQRTH